MTVCITGATGFIGAHVARLLSGKAPVRVTYRAEERLDRLGEVDVEPIRADTMDRSALRRAFRDCELVYHTVGYVGSRPPERVWEVNALGPRIAVEAAAAEGVRRIVVTSSVAGIGPAPPGEIGSEDDVYRASGLTYADAKHEGESEALAAGARLGIEVIVVNPSYVFGVPVDRSQPGETSNRMIGNYLRGRLPAIVDGETNASDVRDVAQGHLRAAERGIPGERYVLGGHDIRWIDLIERVAELSGVHYPVLVLPKETARVARMAETLHLPGVVPAEAFELMARNWRFSSRKAKRELGYRVRALNTTLRDTIEWYRDLIERGAFNGDSVSSMSVAAAWVRLADRVGVLGGLRTAERYLGRRLLGGA